MCCFAEFVVKYVLIISNLVFALAGLAVIGLGSYAHVQLNQLHDVLPANLTFLSISIIVIGCIVFVIAFCACSGAIRESQCMLITYAVFMGILAAIKIYVTVVIFRFLDNALETVSNWLTNAFATPNVRPTYNTMETLFQCCGTVGPESYSTIGQPLPPTCCYNPDMVTLCTLTNSYQGCIPRVGEYFETFGEAIGGVLIVIIIIEFICLIFGLFLACQIRNKRYR